MLERTEVSKWLLSCPYGEQKRACTEGVDVLLYVKDGKPYHQRKSVSNLTKSDIKQVFGPTAIRTVAEQKQFVPVARGGLLVAAMSKTDTEHRSPRSALAKTSQKNSAGYFRIAIAGDKPVLEKCDEPNDFAIPIIVRADGRSKPFEIVLESK